VFKNGVVGGHRGPSTQNASRRGSLGRGESRSRREGHKIVKSCENRLRFIDLLQASVHTQQTTSPFFSLGLHFGFFWLRAADGVAFAGVDGADRSLPWQNASRWLETRTKTYQYVPWQTLSPEADDARTRTFCECALSPKTIPDHKYAQKSAEASPNRQIGAAEYGS